MRNTNAELGGDQDPGTGVWSGLAGAFHHKISMVSPGEHCKLLLCHYNQPLRPCKEKPPISHS